MKKPLSALPIYIMQIYLNEVFDIKTSCSVVCLIWMPYNILEQMDALNQFLVSWPPLVTIFTIISNINNTIFYNNKQLKGYEILKYVQR